MGLINVRKAVFVIRRLILVMFEVFVVVVKRGKGCNVCVSTLCRFLSGGGKILANACWK